MRVLVDVLYTEAKEAAKSRAASDMVLYKRETVCSTHRVVVRTSAVKSPDDENNFTSHCNIGRFITWCKLPVEVHASCGLSSVEFCVSLI
jgi:hypothetical protein